MKDYSFMLSRRIAIRAVEELGYATANLSARKGLPEKIRNNPIIFPDTSLMNAGEFQANPGSKAIRLMNNSWQKLRREVTAEISARSAQPASVVTANEQLPAKTAVKEEANGAISGSSGQPENRDDQQLPAKVAGEKNDATE